MSANFINNYLSVLSINVYTKPYQANTVASEGHTGIHTRQESVFIGIILCVLSKIFDFIQQQL